MLISAFRTLVNDSKEVIICKSYVENVLY